MTNIIYFLVVGLFLVDMTLTYRYVKAYKKMYPKNKWWLAEANPILRTSMKHMGLGKGIIFGGTIILTILIISTRLLPDYYLVFLLGMYSMANVYHFANWGALKRLKKQVEENPEYKKQRDKLRKILLKGEGK